MTLDTRTTGPDAVRPGSARAWLVACRPRSLLVAISPVIVGAALGFERGSQLHVGAGLLTLACAVLVQVITNLQNDVGYTVRGGERSGTRTGLPRATANGWLSVSAVRIAIVALACVAALLAAALAATRGWPVIAIGAASLVAALAYMAGPRPIAYTPFGELTVFVFFGLIGVTGTDWVLTGRVGPATVLAAIAIGSLSAGALVVNNHRDIEHDRLVGRRTFAATFGARVSEQLYVLCLLVPFALLPIIAVVTRDAWLLAPLALAPATLRLRRRFAACEPGIAFNAVLFGTFELGLKFAALLSAGAVIGRLAH